MGFAIARTSDGGAHWTSSDSLTDAALSEVVFIDETHGWAAGWAGDWDYSWQVLLRTTDGGVTWSEL